MQISNHHSDDRIGTCFTIIHLLVRTDVNTKEDLHVMWIIYHVSKHFWFIKSPNPSGGVPWQASQNTHSTAETGIDISILKIKLTHSRQTQK